jgi:transposase
MDREVLEQLVGDGLSLAEIGRRVDLHEATVGYWVKKHGLRAVNRDKHIARGGLRREDLESLVGAGMSSAQIAEVVGLSKTTVRHWLREFGLQTEWAERRHASKERQHELVLRCARHGLTPFRRRREGGYRCAKCRSEAVARRRRKVKQVLVDDAGGRCRLCGYDRSVAALEFHHLVPAEKSFSLSHRGVARSLEKARAEAKKCALLCANCHAEVEAGLIKLAPDDVAGLQSRNDPAMRPG